MDENVRKLRVGIFVLMAIVILGILIVANSEGWVSQYDIYVTPERAPGVTVGTPVRKNGILIGRVKGVRSDDENGLVILQLGINQDVKIYENEICEIGTESVLGDAKLEFLPLPKAERGEPVPVNFTMNDPTKVRVRKEPMEIVTDLGSGFAELKPKLTETLTAFQEAGVSIKNAGDKVTNLSEQIEKAFQDQDGEFSKLVKDLRLLTQKGRAAVENLNAVFENIKVVLDDPENRKRFKDAIGEIPKIFEQLRITIEDTRVAVQQFGQLPKKFDTTIENVEVFTASLKKEGPEILKKVNTNLVVVEKFIGELKGVSKLLKKFQNADGTVVKLFQDDELYRSILDAVSNVKKETIRIGPVIDDIRSFTDAIARDPYSLGVRGAFDRRPPKTGYKASSGKSRR